MKTDTVEPTAGAKRGKQRAEDLIYLDATPRQGDETLPGWAAFRIAHLRDDDTSAATLDAHAEHLTFLGGTGSCVLDDYVTQVGAHHYRYEWLNVSEQYCRPERVAYRLFGW